jgi:hypothetical protein
MTAAEQAWDWRPERHRDAAQVRAARAGRLAAEVTVRVRCGGQLHTIRLQGGRLSLDGHTPGERRRALVGPGGGATVGVLRCLAVLAAWRAAGRPGRGYWVKTTPKPDRYKIADQTLPSALRRAREQSIDGGRRRADLRGWLSMQALAADVAGTRLAAQAIRIEYALIARPRLLLTPPRITVNVVPATTGRRVKGTANPDLDDDGVDRCGLSAQIRHDWLRTLWWTGRGIVDRRVVLDVDHDPDGWPRAWVIDWAAPHWSLAEPRATTTVPGELDALPVPLGRDRAGRWHLLDPDAGTVLRNDPDVRPVYRDPA